jgi:hypothetical protein
VIEVHPGGTMNDRVPVFEKVALDEFTVWPRPDDVLVR